LFLILTTFLVGTLFIPAAAQRAPSTQPGGQRQLIVGGVDQAGQLSLTVNRTAVLTTAAPYKRVSVGNPDVVDFNAIAPTSILVTAKKPGVTQLIVWDEAERSQSIDLVVMMDLRGIQEQLRAAFPDARIEIIEANGVIVLRGRAPSLAVAEQAAQIAAPYGAKVLNFLEIAGGQQVQLQVRFAEVSRSALTALGVNGAFVAGSGFGGSNIGQVSPTALIPGEGSLVGDTPAPQGIALTGDQLISPAVTLYGGGQIGSVFVEAFVQALRQNNLLRILSEPNLIAISGQEASFLAGGEYPIPVAQSGAGAGGGVPAITIEYREYGVRLTFVPIVLGDGRVRLKVAPEVSDLDFSTAVRFGGFLVPGLTTRKVSTTIELGDGQSFAIAGLLNSSVTTSKDVTPLLGDLPVVGALFRSVRYQRKETELVVLVTPRLVAPLNPDQVPALPGERWRHPKESDLFWKRDLGGPAVAATQPTAGRTAPLFQGAYGFAPTTQPVIRAE
jgi:pilus assembly protein CpaC